MPPPSWDALLRQLAETPRENGTPDVHRAARFLYDALGDAGLDPQMWAFAAHPHALRLAGVIALAGGVLYLRLVFAGRFRAALLAALVLPAVLLAELDFGVPVVGWIGAETQHHVVAAVEPGGAPERILVLAAHYDTKTDLLDHLERAPVDLLGGPIAAVLVLGALAGLASQRATRRRGLLRGVARAAGVAGALYGLASFLALTAGVFVPARSPGALDDGGSVAALVRVAGELASAPPERTRVEIWLLSAEEVGVQGSRAYARERFAEPPELPTYVLNLEGLGASTRHAVLGSERFTLRAYEPDPRLVGWLGAVHEQYFGRPLERTAFGGATDARSFLARGVPAATLISRAPGARVTRGLHSAADDRSRIDESALRESAEYLLRVVRAVDADGP